MAPLPSRHAAHREFEEAATRGMHEKLVLGAVHPSIGQEAVPVGVCAQLARTDILLSTHRGHGHTLAKGAEATPMMLELGKEGRSGGVAIRPDAVSQLRFTNISGDIE
jgi:TPP-dependent pyruvate/acetoin dehydrogenase alpha subunit